MAKSQALRQAVLLCISFVVLSSTVQAVPLDSNPVNNTTISQYPRGSGSSGEESDPETSRRMTIPAAKHPVSSGDIYLFHGANDLSVATSIMKSGLQMSDKKGDFNPGKAHALGGVGGAAYLTDSLTAAAQFVCYSKKLGNKPPKEAHVVRFEFEGKGADVKRYTDKTEEWREFTERNMEKTPWERLKTSKNAKLKEAYEKAEKLFKESDIIEGPMDTPIVDAKLTPNFWQYAIVKPEWLHTQKLKPVALYPNIPCPKVPTHPHLTDQMYLDGQYLSATPSEHFTAVLKELETEEKKGTDSGKTQETEEKPEKD